MAQWIWAPKAQTMYERTADGTIDVLFVVDTFHGYLDANTGEEIAERHNMIDGFRNNAAQLAIRASQREFGRSDWTAAEAAGALDGGGPS